MTITTITPTSLSYTIDGAGDQRVYFQGYGKPNTITGGTVVLGAGDSLVVTTTGAGDVAYMAGMSVHDLLRYFEHPETEAESTVIKLEEMIRISPL